MANVLVGTSGWNYPTGQGTWNGVFYPSRRSRGFDELAYYAERFRTVEVNSTFYHPPEPDIARRWLQRTPGDFTFSVKLYQKFTHPEMYLAKAGTRHWDVTEGDLDQFRAGLAPLAEAGRLAALLVQFPSSFKYDADSLAYVDWLTESLREYGVVVEVRHRSWSDNRAALLDCLARHGASWVYIDEPKFLSSVRQSLSSDGSGLVYIRLHGRNAANWWDHNEAEDRYDYLYRSDELSPIAAAATDAAARGRKVLMYLNNHFSAKAVANAVVLRNQLGEDVPGTYPRAFIEAYPEVRGIVGTNTFGDLGS